MGSDPTNSKKFQIFSISFQKPFLLLPKYFLHPNYHIFLEMSIYWWKSAFWTYSVPPIIRHKGLINLFVVVGECVVGLGK